MGTSGLPDIYTRSPRATGPRAEGVYIRQITRLITKEHIAMHANLILPLCTPVF